MLLFVHFRTRARFNREHQECIRGSRSKILLIFGTEERQDYRRQERAQCFSKNSVSEVDAVIPQLINLFQSGHSISKITL